MQVTQMTLEQIKPYPKNPRILKNAVRVVANSIKQFGFQQPILVDKNNVIIAGHARYEAAKQLGLRTVPVIVCSDLTPAQVKAYRLADNKTAEEASWDIPMLSEELKGIDKMFDMKDFGFTDFVINFNDVTPSDLDYAETRKINAVKEVTCPKCGAVFEI